jgi:ABC-type transport system substrate-binding protein
MAPTSRLVTAFFGLVAVTAATGTAVAQKHGGILKQYIIDSPASMSIHEETTVVAERPMMGVFNNLVMFDQHVAQNSLASIVPDLATDWSWDEDGTRLIFHLRTASNGMTASSSPPPTSNAPGTWCKAKRQRSCASTRGRLGTPTSRKW